MRKILALLFVLSVVSAYSVTVATNVVNWQTVTDSTVIGNTNTITGASIPPATYLIQQGSLGSTNYQHLQVAVQASFDGLNWTTLTNFVPVTTNAAVSTFVPQFGNLTVYMRATATTTNAIGVAITQLRTQ